MSFADDCVSFWCLAFVVVGAYGCYRVHVTLHVE